jgi:hypothetical protein
MVPESSGATAATWRNGHGQVTHTTDASTMCWAPRVYGHLHAVGEDGFSTILPCYKCPGCREFERRRLEKRLQQRYQDYQGELFAFTIKAPLKEQARLSSNLHRRPSLQLEPGFFRYGPDHFLLLARSREPLAAILEKCDRPYTVQKLRKPGRRRQWAPVSAGLLIARGKYGQDTNRWYARGLPAVEKHNWTIERANNHERFDWRSAPRAWRANGTSLRPPEAWQNHGHNSRSHLIAIQSVARTPEQAAQLQGLITAVAAARQLPLTDAASAALTAEEKARGHAIEEMRRQGQIAQAKAIAKQASSVAVTEVLDNKDPPKRQILSDEDLARTGPRGFAAWQERDMAEFKKRTAADGEARSRQRQYDLEEFARFANRGKRAGEKPITAEDLAAAARKKPPSASI